MIVRPYAKPPAAATVAVAIDERQALDEHGELHELGRTPPATRVYGDYHAVRRWFHESHRGELFAWQGHAYRWRHEPDRGWRALPGDVYLLKLGDVDPFELLPAVVGWRDWLRSEGATLTGSMGSAAMSLLRARLERPLWTRVGDHPPVYWTLGGRQELGRSGPGSFTGRVCQFDMPSAYARELAAQPYGGRWRKVRSSWLRGRWADAGVPVFVRARVKLDSARTGFGPGYELWPPLPLMGRPGRRRQPADAFEAMTLVEWLASGRHRGVWPAAELQAALGTGACSLDEVTDVWAHFPEAGDVDGRYPLAPWLAAVERGRCLPGLVGSLAKQTGNALWGQLCINPNGKRRIHTYRRGPRGAWRLVPDPLPDARGLGARRAIAPELAEHVAGAIRGRLLRGMAEAGPRMLAVHTDGGWFDCSDGWQGPQGWRVKTETRELRLIDPQTLAFLRQGGGWTFMVAGSVEPAASFEERWKGVRHGLDRQTRGVAAAPDRASVDARAGTGGGTGPAREAARPRAA